MRPIVTDRVAWSVCMSVCWSVSLVSPAKTAETIKMPFRLWAVIDLKNVLDDGLQVVRDLAMAFDEL